MRGSRNSARRCTATSPTTTWTSRETPAGSPALSATDRAVPAATVCFGTCRRPRPRIYLGCGRRARDGAHPGALLRGVRLRLGRRGARLGGAPGPRGRRVDVRRGLLPRLLRRGIGRSCGASSPDTMAEADVSARLLSRRGVGCSGRWRPDGPLLRLGRRHMGGRRRLGVLLLVGVVAAVAMSATALAGGGNSANAKLWSGLGRRSIGPTGRRSRTRATVSATPPRADVRARLSNVRSRVRLPRDRPPEHVAERQPL